MRSPYRIFVDSRSWMWIHDHGECGFTTLANVDSRPRLLAELASAARRLLHTRRMTYPNGALLHSAPVHVHPVQTTSGHSVTLGGAVTNVPPQLVHLARAGGVGEGGKGRGEGEWRGGRTERPGRTKRKPLLHHCFVLGLVSPPGIWWVLLPRPIGGKTFS